MRIMFYSCVGDFFRVLPLHQVFLNHKNMSYLHVHVVGSAHVMANVQPLPFVFVHMPVWCVVIVYGAERERERG